MLFPIVIPLLWSVTCINAASDQYNIVDADKIRIPYNGASDVPGFQQTSTPPNPLPGAPKSQDQAAEDDFFKQLKALFPSRSASPSCDQCLGAYKIMHSAALKLPPNQISDLIIRACSVSQLFGDPTGCQAQYSGTGGLGPYYAQLFYNMNENTGDMTALCAFQHSGACPTPSVAKIKESDWFSPKKSGSTGTLSTRPRPTGGKSAGSNSTGILSTDSCSKDRKSTPTGISSTKTHPTKSGATGSSATGRNSTGKTLNVLHMSDIHLDVRYDLGSEASCSNGPCCRSTSQSQGGHVSNPATRWGYYSCDSPADLPLSAFATMKQFVDPADVAFSIFTGDIVSHDGQTHVSIDYVSYEEEKVYDMFKVEMPNVPVYATLGNHDSFPEMVSAYSSDASSWNYNLISSLWLKNKWIDGPAADSVKTHFGAYAYTVPQGFKVISLNTDFWYIDNIFNYANYTNPDQSGMLKFLIAELTASEKINQRVWIIGHVPNGYGNTDPLPNPSALFHSIVVRFSPKTIAMIAWGHTHADQKIIYYDFAPSSLDAAGLRDTTKINTAKPLNVGWIAPSLTPFSNLNAGWVLYQVSPTTFSVIDAQTIFADVSQASKWTDMAVWKQEYDARKTYDPKGSWPKHAPLNATFWDQYLVQAMDKDPKVAETYAGLETKGSTHQSQSCAGAACAKVKKCHIQSGSAAAAAGCGSGG